MYVKLFSRILRSSIWSEPLPVRVMWVTLLADADSEGLVYGTVDALARLANMSVEDTEIAINRLLAPDERSTLQAEDGRRLVLIAPNMYRVVNYKHYRSLVDMEHVREMARQRSRAYYWRKKAGVSSDADNESLTESDAILTDSHADLTQPHYKQKQKQKQKQDTAEAAAAAEPHQEEHTAQIHGPQALLELWNSMVVEARAANPLVKIRTAERLNDWRVRHARARLAEEPNLDTWRLAISRLLASPGCNGINDRSWVANFDFLLRPKTLTAAIEGQYENWGRWGVSGIKGETTSDEVTDDGSIWRVTYGSDGKEVRRRKLVDGTAGARHDD